MDPISKTGVGGIVPKLPGQDDAQAGKTGDSKFRGLQESQKEAGGGQAQGVAMPPPAQEVTPVERKKIETDLRKKIETSGAKNPQELFKAEMDKTRVTLGKLRKQVDSIPRNSGGNAIQDRLSQVEAKFQESEKMLAGMKNLDSPRDLLKMQMQMYQMTQNIEIVSKVVDSTSSGVKQILQTQV